MLEKVCTYFPRLRTRRTSQAARTSGGEQQMCAIARADHGYILENGRIVMEGAANDLRENENVKEFYVGMAGGGDDNTRKSFKGGKSYKRRKRWLS